MQDLNLVKCRLVCLDCRLSKSSIRWIPAQAAKPGTILELNGMMWRVAECDTEISPQNPVRALSLSA
jgi:hypothetical protein